MSLIVEPGCFPAAQTAFPGPYKKDANLINGVWHMLANGRIFTLTIEIGSSSNPTVELSSGEIENSRWEPNARMLSFTRKLPSGLEQEFTGYLMDYDDSDPKARMAGVFGEKGKDPQAGWYATRPKS